MLSKKEENLYLKILNNDFKTSEEDHPTASSFVLNPQGDSVLFIYNKKYDSWSWMGGHLEEAESPIEASIRELEEESGIKAEPISKTPVLVQKLWAGNHYHYDTCFIYIIDEELPIQINTKESYGIRWIPIKNLSDFVTEDHMMPIYEKIIKRSRELF